MGPLIPQNIINGDLNFFFAFIIGVAFGFILEQAGFSSSRKLAGVFYGYDFVVLKVFFTAGITAATGLFFLKYLGWVDFEFLYINPLYVWSALIGGVVMGFGFILGGFCPGTSLGAAVIGKIDAWFFIAGMFMGVFIFGIFYPFFEPLHMGSFLGNPFIYETLGISQKWFLFFLIIMALTAFVVTQLIEDNSTKFKELLYNKKLSLRFPVAFIIILAFIAIFLPEKRNSFLNEKPSRELMNDLIIKKRYVCVDKVLHSIMNNINDINFVDVRSKGEFADYHLPGAVNVPVENILDAHLRNLINNKDKTTVLYSNGSSKADVAWFFLSRQGYENIYVMEGGLNYLFDAVFTDLYISEEQNIDAISRNKFLKRAKVFFKENNTIKKDNNKDIPIIDEVNTKSVKGGC